MVTTTLLPHVNHSRLDIDVVLLRTNYPQDIGLAKIYGLERVVQKSLLLNPEEVNTNAK